jgi:hypothetical protein
MERKNERNVENLLRSGNFSTPEHKESLRSKLFAQSSGLSLDELDSVVGGKSSGKKEPKTVTLECPVCGVKGKQKIISGNEAQCTNKKCKAVFSLKGMG